MSPHVATLGCWKLGAIQLATAERLGEAPQLMTVVTRDARVGENARALGFAVA